MARPRLEVADVFRAHGAAWRKANAGHVSLAQLKVMSAIETCRTAALGGHVERCEDCAHGASPTIPAATATARSARAPRRGNGSQSARPNSCRSPTSTSSSRCRPRSPTRVPEQGRRLRPPVQGGRRDAADHRRRPEASRRPHRPHRRAAHLGLGAHPPSARPRHRARRRPVAGRHALDRLQPGFFLPVRVLSLFRRLFLKAARRCTTPAGSRFFGDLAPLADKRLRAASRRCARSAGSSTPSGPSPDRKRCSPICRATPTASPSPTAGSSRSTRAASPSNGRTTGSKAATGYQVMTLDADEFIRRFLLHVLPSGFHRIRHYGLLASGARAPNIARARELLAAPPPPPN